MTSCKRQQWTVLTLRIPQWQFLVKPAPTDGLCKWEGHFGVVGKARVVGVVTLGEEPGDENSGQTAVRPSITRSTVLALATLLSYWRIYSAALDNILRVVYACQPSSAKWAHQNISLSGISGALEWDTLFMTSGFVFCRARLCLFLRYFQCTNLILNTNNNLTNEWHCKLQQLIISSELYTIYNLWNGFECIKIWRL